MAAPTKPKPTPDLRISPSLALPLAAVTETFAVLGRRGSGKTNTAVVMAEEMIEAQVPVVIIDPTGAWWGLRSSSDGTGDGLPVVIFGGEHADVPLDEKAGELIADAIVDGRFPAIIDLSGLSKNAMRRFMAVFAERLYRRNREPAHVFIDEADVLVPQRLSGEGLRVFGAVDDIVRRGRIRGLGVTVISQRPAVINWDILSQAEVLIALQLTSPLDVKAIDNWIKNNATTEEAQLVKGSLAGLPTGTGWIWSPALLGILERVEIRARHTFDSSATPRPGQTRVVAKAFAPVDAAALSARIEVMAALTKDTAAAAADPKALRARIIELEAQLEAARTQHAGTAAPQQVIEVPALTPEQEATLARSTEAIREYAANASTRAEQAVAQIRAQVAELGDVLDALSKARARARDAVPAHDAASKPAAPAAPAGRASSGSPSPFASSSAGGTAARLGKTERTLLTVLVQHGPMEHDLLALLSGYSSKASTIGVSLAKLRRAGLVHPGRPITATDEGTAQLGDSVEPLPTGQALIDYWRNRFGLTEQRVLDAVLAAYPEATSQAEIAAATGYSPTASTIGVALSRLRKTGVIDGWALSESFVSAVGPSNVSVAKG